VDLGGVDGADGGFGVGVGGEEDALGFGVERHGGLQEVDAGHAGHALVGEEEGDGFLALDELLADVESCAAGGCSDDAVVLAVVAAEVLDDGFEYAGVVVDGEEDGLGHGCFACYSDADGVTVDALIGFRREREGSEYGNSIIRFAQAR